MYSDFHVLISVECGSKENFANVQTATFIYCICCVQRKSGGDSACDSNFHCSSVCAGSAFVDIPRRGGCFNSGMLAWAFAMSEQKMRPDLMAQENWDEILDIRPLEDIPRKALGHEVPFLAKWLSHMDMDILCMMWLEHFLKGVENGIENTSTVEYYTVGENQWKQAATWPVENVTRTMYYLDGEGNNLAAGTGTTCGKGNLSCTLPENAGTDTYEYDPDHPSVHVIDLSENELEVPEDYTEEEKRADILSYSTPVLQEPFTVNEDMTVRLYVSCDCPDTDFMVRITDVDENGKSIKLADGVIGAKYRNGFETPEYMEPGKIYEIHIRTTKISNTFLPGHRMRVMITSSAKNFIFPNSNTENGFNSEKRQKAHITVHRGGKYTSGILISVENK